MNEKDEKDEKDVVYVLCTPAGEPIQAFTDKEFAEKEAALLEKDLGGGFHVRQIFLNDRT